MLLCLCVDARGRGWERRGEGGSWPGQKRFQRKARPTSFRCLEEVVPSLRGPMGGRIVNMAKDRIALRPYKPHKRLFPPGYRIADKHLHRMVRKHIRGPGG
jgi:hypothetical protein